MSFVTDFNLTDYTFCTNMVLQNYFRFLGGPTIYSLFNNIPLDSEKFDELVKVYMDIFKVITGDNMTYNQAKAHLPNLIARFTSQDFDFVDFLNSKSGGGGTGTPITFTGPYRLLGSNASGQVTEGKLVNDNYIDNASISKNKIIGLEEFLQSLDGRLNLIEDSFPITVEYNTYNEADDTWTTVTKVLSNIASVYTFVTDTIPTLYKATRNIFNFLRGTRLINGIPRGYQELIEEFDDVDDLLNNPDTGVLKKTTDIQNKVNENTQRIFDESKKTIENTGKIADQGQKISTTADKVTDIQDKLGFDPQTGNYDGFDAIEKFKDDSMLEFGYDEGTGKMLIKNQVEQVVRSAAETATSLATTAASVTAMGATVSGLSSSLASLAGPLAGLGGMLGLLGLLGLADSNGNPTTPPDSTLFVSFLSAMITAGYVTLGSDTKYQLTPGFKGLLGKVNSIEENLNGWMGPMVTTLANNDLYITPKLAALGIVVKDVNNRAVSPGDTPPITYKALIDNLVLSTSLIASTVNNVTTYSANPNLGKMLQALITAGFLIPSTTNGITTYTTSTLTDIPTKVTNATNRIDGLYTKLGLNTYTPQLTYKDLMEALVTAKVLKAYTDSNTGVTTYTPNYNLTEQGASYTTVNNIINTLQSMGVINDSSGTLKPEANNFFTNYYASLNTPSFSDDYPPAFGSALRVWLTTSKLSTIGMWNNNTTGYSDNGLIARWDMAYSQGTTYSCYAPKEGPTLIIDDPFLKGYGILTERGGFANASLILPNNLGSLSSGYNTNQWPGLSVLFLVRYRASIYDGGLNGHFFSCRTTASFDTGSLGMWLEDGYLTANRGQENKVYAYSKCVDGVPTGEKLKMFGGDEHYYLVGYHIGRTAQPLKSWDFTTSPPNVFRSYPPGMSLAITLSINGYSAITSAFDMTFSSLPYMSILCQSMGVNPQVENTVYPFKGVVRDIAMYNKYLEPDELQTVADYFRNKYKLKLPQQ